MKDTQPERVGLRVLTLLSARSNRSRYRLRVISATIFSFWAWWVEALVFSVLLGFTQLICRSWLLVGFARNCAKHGMRPDVLIFFFLCSATSAVVIFATCGVVLLGKLLLAGTLSR